MPDPKTRSASSLASGALLPSEATPEDLANEPRPAYSEELGAHVWDSLAGDLSTWRPEPGALEMGLDMRDLSLFHRALLVTDGTVTKLLEACLREPVHAVKLSQEWVKARTKIPCLAVRKGEEVILRRVLLVGLTSQSTYGYAESVLVPQRLGPQFVEELEKAGRDLGRVIRQSRLETYREVLRCGRELAKDLGGYFHLASTDYVLSRTYRILAMGQPVMLITEKFPPTDPTAGADERSPRGRD